MAAQRFEAELQLTGKTGTYIVLPFDAREVFGQARAPVRGTVEGFPFRSTVAVYGGRYYLVANRHVREGAGVEAGQTVTIELDRDDEPREVDVPEDLAAALASDRAAQQHFDGFSYSHRREYVEWIEEAKREETRRRRIGKAVAMIAEGRTQR